MKADNLLALRHTAEHVLQYAVRRLWPGKIFEAIGPATNEGFYFDFETKGGLKITPKDFAKIEAEMQRIVAADLPVRQEKVSFAKARRLFAHNPYKRQLLKELKEKGEPITLYWLGEEYVDLCRGPHVDSTGKIGAFKLLKIAGAYWRGEESNKMLTRIYGTAFPTQKALKDYLTQLKEAKKRDHRVLGRRLKLFLIDNEFGAGLPLWLPAGAVLRQIVMDFALDTYLRCGYQLVATPHIARLELWQRSGHWDFYRQNMYPPIEFDNQAFVIKPMNCPAHVKIYQQLVRSFRDLPLRLTEMGTVYRYERPGVLHGLTRVRGFTQDDAHIFCTQEQLEEEVEKVVELTLAIYRVFEMPPKEVSLSVRDPKAKRQYLGDDQVWKVAETALEKVLQKKKLAYRRYPGEAAFYGPKIDFIFKDALGRPWQLSTIQVDFNFPQRFNLTYVDSQGKKKRPIMIHRALLGSLERFLGVLIEHYGGAFPVWLAPTQAVVLPISEKQSDYAREIVSKLQSAGLRVVLDASPHTLSYRIRSWERQKVPYLLIVGAKEEKERTINLRQRGNKQTENIDLDTFLVRLKKEAQIPKISL